MPISTDVFHHLKDAKRGTTYYVQPCESGGFFVTSLLDKTLGQRKEPLEDPSPLSGAHPAPPDENPSELRETLEEEVKGAKQPPDIFKHQCLRGPIALE